MKQFKAFTSTFGVNVLLCCSAAVLLTACGGNSDASNTQLSATAAEVTTDAGAASATSKAEPAAAVDARPEAAPAAGTEPAPATADADATEQPANATQAFELTGYDNNPLQAQIGQQGDGANVPATMEQ